MGTKKLGVPLLAVLSAALGAASCASSAASPGLAAKVGGVELSIAQIDGLAGDELFRVRSDEYSVRKRHLDREVERVVLDLEAKARKTSVEALLRTEVESKVTAVTDAEVKAVYATAKERLGNLSEEQATEKLRASLNQQRSQQRRSEFVQALRAKFGVTWLLDAPRVDLGEVAGPSRGASGAPVKIVEFADFQCPFCAKAAPTLADISKRYGDKVQVIYADFPLGFHGNARKAAEAGACADEQGKFWAMHDKMYANVQALDPDKLKGYAAELGLDAGRFNECLDSGRKSAAVTADMQIGQKAGVTGTPAFFINGRMLAGALPVQSFADIIDEELDRQGAGAGGAKLTRK